MGKRSGGRKEEIHPNCAVDCVNGFTYIGSWEDKPPNTFNWRREEGRLLEIVVLKRCKYFPTSYVQEKVSSTGLYIGLGLYDEREHEGTVTIAADKIVAIHELEGKVGGAR